MTITTFNTLSQHERQKNLFNCCGATRWVKKMMQAFPFENKEALLNAAKKNWQACSENDWLEAFQHHPRIGDVKSLAKKFSDTAHWAKNEQGAVEAAPLKTIEALAEGNRLYEEKFGFIFIVCATGKSAAAMLQLLGDRLKNERNEELKIAAAEQEKITELRLQKLLT
ncbi:MAG TPA: 2-oxo-4-hydroxy-4-carboxy-5-ureidoimidazoline decarboxylase [Chitinophagaceae bacterium]|nr:2-oxo-4-hydroxy-4-carboxy-5-ureidoimidazoline decarboxylase [Chitinophagaceae bacterium]